MGGTYDKLGEMLKEAINTGSFPEAEKKQKNFSESKEKNKKRDNSVKNISTNVQKYIHIYKYFNLNPENCSEAELKEAYHSMLKKYHPDNFSYFPETRKMADLKTKEIIRNYKKLLEVLKESD